MAVFDYTFDFTFQYQTPVSLSARGSGILNGGGVYPAGVDVEIEAIPASYMQFRHWIYEDQIIEENPYTFRALEKEMNFIAVFYMLIEDYLKGMIGYPVSDASVYAAETNRDIVFGSDTATVSVKQRDLALADLITIICQSPSITGGEETMGDWKSKQSSMSVNGVAALMKRANAIYEKYGENASGLRLKDRTDAW